MALSHKILIFFNVLTALMGLVMLAGAIYLFVDPSWKAYVNLTAIWAAGGAGLAIFFVSFMGCFGATKGNKPLLGFYLLLVLIILAAQIAGAYFIGVYLGVLNGQALSGSSYVTTSTVTTAIASNSNNLVLSAYTSCCSGCPSPAEQAFFAPINISCTADQATQLNGTASYQQANCANGNLCLPVAVCSSQPDNKTACFWDASGAPTIVPPYYIVPAACEALSAIKINSTTTVKLVGPASVGSCGGGNPLVFQQQSAAYAAASAQWILIIAGIVAFLEFLLVFATIFALCDKSDPK